MAQTRGLCTRHYQALVRAVAAGLTTYEAEEKAGRLKVKRPRVSIVFPKKP